MREKEYLQCLHFGVLVQGKLGEHMHHIACCANGGFFFTVANLAKKITSADPNVLLSSNMAVQLSSWPIRVYFVLILQMVYQIKLYQ